MTNDDDLKSAISALAVEMLARGGDLREALRIAGAWQLSELALEIDGIEISTRKDPLMPDIGEMSRFALLAEVAPSGSTWTATVYDHDKGEAHVQDGFPCAEWARAWCDDLLVALDWRCL